MNPIITTAPTLYPVSVAEARAQLDIGHDETDARIAGHIAAATSLVETYLNRALISRTYTAYMDEWPEGCSVSRLVELPRAPLISVTSVKTYDDSDVATTMSASDYYVDTKSLVGRIILRSSASWPTPERVGNGIEIVWVAGYGSNPADVPEDIRAAILVTVGWLNEQRGDETDPQDIPAAAKALAGPYRIWTL